MSTYTPYVPEPPTPALAGRHPVNVGHLVMGVAFTGLVLIWALNISGGVTGSSARFLLPLPWVAAGLAGLVAGRASRRNRTKEYEKYRAEQAAWLAEQEHLAMRWDLPADSAPATSPYTTSSPQDAERPSETVDPGEMDGAAQPTGQPSLDETLPLHTQEPDSAPTPTKETDR